MVEEYKLDNNQYTQEVTLGYFVNKVLKKQEDDYGQESANKTRERVCSAFSKCMELVNSNNQNKNVLFIGKVQSGKTSNLEMFTAFSFDNGYGCVVIYGGYDTKLLAQTSKRFKKTFDIVDDEIQNNNPELFSTNDDEEFESLDEDVLTKLIELKKPIILVSMKRPNALKKINNILSDIQKYNIKTFIIDDEGDQASLNTEFKKHKDSPTYKEIVEMKNLLNNPLYISVTATPQANVLLGAYSKLKPEKLFLIEPGNGYTGAEFFHFDDKHIVRVNDNDLTKLEQGKVPDSLRDAINYFLIASAIMKTIGYQYTDMIIHTHRTNKEHKEIYGYIFQYIDALKVSIKEKDDSLYEQLKSISSVYNEKYFSKNVLDLHPFDSIKEMLIDVIKDTNTILQDSLGTATQGNLKYKYHKIYIGGDLLQRGLTFKYLITTYFTRWPKNSGNMDTTIQRARRFGYRSKYLDLCKLFTTYKIQNEYTYLSDSESDLWEQCYLIENGELNIDDIVIDANSSSLNPTRKNVVNYKSVKFNRRWNNQKRIFLDKAINTTNNNFIKSFLSKFTYEPSLVGRINKNIPSCFFTKISKEDAIELIEKTSSIFDYEPFNRKDLIKLFEQYPVVIEKMFGLYNTNDDFRERTLNPDKTMILALQQGPDSADESNKTYKGDAYVIVDENAIIIQIFQIRPRLDKQTPLNEYEQFMFSIHVPESQKNSKKYVRN